MNVDVNPTASLAPTGATPVEVHSSYPVSVRWAGDRLVVTTSPDRLPELVVSPPPAFAGPPGFWSPEHLFVLAAASCWLATFVAMATASHLAVAAVSAEAEGAVVRGADRRFQVARIVLRPQVTIERETDRERALRLIAKAEEGCLIGRSMATEIALEPLVRVAS